MKVLIVDDHVYVLEGLKEQVVEYWPSEVSLEVVAVPCFSGDEAIEAVKSHQPDILFLDYSLGGDKTGKDVALWIDEHYQKPIRVATQTLREEEKARELFAGTRCVTYYLPQGIMDFDRIREFVESCAKTTPITIEFPTGVPHQS